MIFNYDSYKNSKKKEDKNRILTSKEFQRDGEAHPS
jgi:hypothetical protein